MKTRPSIFSWLVVIALAALVLMPAPAPRGEKSILGIGGLSLVAQAAGGNYAKYDVIANLAPEADVRDVARAHDLPIVRKLRDRMHLFRLQTSDSRTVEQVIAELGTNPAVEWVEPNFLAKVPELDSLDQESTPFIDQESVPFIDGSSPSSFFTQYAYTLTQANFAKAVANNGSGVTVAVIDTGIDAGHPVFRNFAQGYDFLSNDWNPAEVSGGPGYGHGTMVAGIIVLVAPQARIMPIRAFDSNGSATTSDITSSIFYAVDSGAKVLNLSFSLTSNSTSLYWAISYALSRGVVVVASAGNTGTSYPRYPAAYSGVLSVGATDQYDRRASFSNYGSYVEVGAPGVNLYSAYPGNRWASWSGTSFAAPLVSGQAALRLARSGGNPVYAIKYTTVSCCGGLFDHGRVNCLAAMYY
jgi:thermitase